MKFISVDAIARWANDSLYLVDGIIYTQKDGLFHYFTLNPADRYYVLAMTSLKDLGEHA